MQVLLDTSKENEARLSSVVESHRQQIIELEGRSGSYESAVGRSEYTVAALQKQQEESQTKILELESRLRYTLMQSINSSLKTINITKLSGGLKWKK